MKRVLSFAFFILSFFVLIGLTLTSPSKVSAQEALSISPTTAGCGDAVTFNAENLDASNTYLIAIICLSGSCMGDSTIYIESISGSTGRTRDHTFNVDGDCGGGGFVASGGIYETFLTWSVGGVNHAAGGTNLTLVSAGGSCTLTQTLIPRIDGQGLVDLADANPNTSYNISMSSSFCTTNSTTYTLGDGTSPALQITCSVAGNYTMSAQSTDSVSPRDCSTVFQVETTETGNCNLSVLTNPIDVGQNINVGLRLGIPSTQYNLGIAPTNCNIPASVVTNSSGAVFMNFSCSVDGTYQLGVTDAIGGSDSCDVTFNVGASYGGCVGETTGELGYCRRPCLQGDFEDGRGGCHLSLPIQRRCCIPQDTPPISTPLGGACAGNRLNTAIGCIPLESPNAFVSFLLRWGLGIGGGIALILIVVAGFQVTTSSGDPKRLQAGKELMTAAIMGLVLLIFSAFILRLIGSDILGIL